MSQERLPISTPEKPEHPSRFARTLRTLEQYRKDVAISFVAATLATIAILVNPSPTNPETQGNITSTADNNPPGIFWSPDLNISQERLGEIIFKGVVFLAAVGGVVYIEDRKRK